jgi:Fe-S cluster assembly ATP-binding protein
MGRVIPSFLIGFNQLFIRIVWKREDEPKTACLWIIPDAPAKHKERQDIQMSDSLLQVKDLSVAIEEGQILHDVNLTIRPGETHVLMGPNGAGKSTLGNTLMGNPVYHVTGGQIFFDGQDITRETTDKRAKAGMFMSFQNPLEVPGLSLESFIRNSLRQQTGKPVRIMQFKKQLEETMALLNMDPSYADRDLNVGFSGGEKKKAEILQMLMLAPKFAILDETDSGLDVDAVRTVSKGIEEYHKRSDGALLIITHNAKILESLAVDYTHVLVKGSLVTTGGADLVQKINEEGFEQYIEEAAKANE